MTSRTRRPRSALRLPPLRWIAGCVLLLLALGACGSSPSRVPPDQRHGPAGSTASGDDQAVSVVAVGDLVCESDEAPTATTCQQQATADLAAGLQPQTVIALGDLQYEAGSRAEFEKAWAPTWGQFDDILAPVPGNHEYGTPAAADYRSYFRTGSYYARDIGGWRVYLLDSNCEEVDCAEESAWLSDQLAQQPTLCTAVAMHHPRVSSGAHGSNDALEPLWAAAVDGGVDLALAGHDHDYERFGHLDDQGEPIDGSGGTRAFVVGTGGKSLYPLRDFRRHGSEFAQDTTFGVLHLTLAPDGYDWQYVAVDGSVLDQGSDSCS
ncbi:hypothetical protein BH11ACT8_BH11ACT8_07600 [soil metagenome]